MQADFATGKEKTGRGLRWVAETIVGLIYPPRCPICDRVTVPECVPCRRCADAVRLAEEPVCKRCGKPLDGGRALRAGLCLVLPLGRAEAVSNIAGLAVCAAGLAGAVFCARAYGLGFAPVALWLVVFARVLRHGPQMSSI